MSIRNGLIEAVARACSHEGISVDKAAAVFLRKLNPDGGFRGKGPQSDLYYTGFALMSLKALGQTLEIPRLLDFLDGFGRGKGLDLAHLAALIRCRQLTATLDPATNNALIRQLETFRCCDGAYHHLFAGQEGSAYGCFLAMAAYEDMQRAVPDAKALIGCIEALSSESGYYNESLLPVVSAPASAAAITTLTALGRTVDAHAAQWLLKSRDANGGFKVMPAAPVADLLSTAVALHALRTMAADIEAIREADVAFVTGLWDERIGFCQNRIDPISDCEYCFYGLLSLGHLR